MVSKNIFLSFVLMLGCFMIHSVSLQGQEVNPSHLQKIYVDASNIILEKDGIFFVNELGYLQNTQSISYDDYGYYILGEPIYRCPNCQWANRQNKCINSKCPMYGK